MRAMYPKRPAKRRWGIRRANILPPRGVFAVRSPQIMHGVRILPPSGGPAPAQGLLPEQLHHEIVFQPPGPCAGMTSHTGRGSWTLLNAWPMCRDDPSASPVPATCRYPPLAAPIAVRDKPPMGFGGDRPAHGLQSGQAPRDRRLRHLDGQADNGMLRRAGPGLQNREQVGAEAPAEAAGPAGPAPALPKTPIERTSPSWRNYRNTASISHCAKSRPQELTPGSALSTSLAVYSPSEFQAVLRSVLFRLECRPVFRLAPADQQRFGASKLAAASLQGTTFRQSASPARRLTLAARYWTSAFHRPCKLQYSYTATGSSPGTTAKSALGSSPG